MDREELKGALSNLFARRGDVALAYLFGSQVEGQLGPLSDLDVAVLLDPALDGAGMQAQIAHELSQALHVTGVDVVLLDRAPVELAYAIVAQGQVIHERDVATRVEFEAQILSRYGDYLPVLRAQRTDILRGDEYVRRVHRYRATLGRTERTLGQIAAAERQAESRV
jgi:predicted nucleotidyltransferase